MFGIIGVERLLPIKYTHIPRHHPEPLQKISEVNEPAKFGRSLLPILPMGMFCLKTSVLNQWLHANSYYIHR